MLAVVENQEKLPVADIFHQRFQNGTASSSLTPSTDAAASWHQTLIRHRGKVDKPHTVGKVVQHFSGDPERKPRLCRGLPRQKSASSLVLPN